VTVQDKHVLSPTLHTFSPKQTWQPSTCAPTHAQLSRRLNRVAQTQPGQRWDKLKQFQLITHSHKILQLCTTVLLLLLWQAPLEVLCSIKRRHQSPELTILCHNNCFFCGDVFWISGLAGYSSFT